MYSRGREQHRIDHTQLPFALTLTAHSEYRVELDGSLYGLFLPTSSLAKILLYSPLSHSPIGYIDCTNNDTQGNDNNGEEE